MLLSVDERMMERSRQEHHFLHFQIVSDAVPCKTKNLSHLYFLCNSDEMSRNVNGATIGRSERKDMKYY